MRRTTPDYLSLDNVFHSAKKICYRKHVILHFCDHLNYEKTVCLFQQKQMPDLRFGVHLGFLAGGEEQDFLNLAVEFEIIREKDFLSNIDQAKHTFENSAHYTQPRYTHNMHSLLQRSIFQISS